MATKKRHAAICFIPKADVQDMIKILRRAARPSAQGTKHDVRNVVSFLTAACRRKGK